MKKPSEYYAEMIRGLGMTGEDGSLSYTKTFGYAVLIAYALCKTIPPSVAITLILSAHGTKTILAAIDKGVFSIKAEDKLNVNLSRSETVIERKGWDNEREYQES